MVCLRDDLADQREVVGFVPRRHREIEAEPDQGTFQIGDLVEVPGHHGQVDVPHPHRALPDNGDEQLFLVGEVVVERAGGDPGLGGDIVDSRTGESRGSEDGASAAEDGLPLLRQPLPGTYRNSPLSGHRWFLLARFSRCHGRCDGRGCLRPRRPEGRAARCRVHRQALQAPHAWHRGPPSGSHAYVCARWTSACRLSSPSLPSLLGCGCLFCGRILGGAASFASRHSSRNPSALRW